MGNFCAFRHSNDKNCGGKQLLRFIKIFLNKHECLGPISSICSKFISISQNHYRDLSNLPINIGSGSRPKRRDVWCFN